VLKTQAIKNFLVASTRLDLANLYNHDMEVQVNVAQDGGERVDGEYKGRKWQGWSDGLSTWKPFRVPMKANTDPEYTDSDIKFDLAVHADAIGMTGWDWKNKVSRWVAFDFDAILGHSEKHTKKLSNEELQRVTDAAMAVDWVTIRKSTAGKGLHLYVMLDPVETANHNEHAALARAILGMMSALVSYDFVSKVDTCGGNMWVWARKMKGTDGLMVVKQGTILTEPPANWRDHLKVVTGTRRKNLPQDIEASGKADAFEELVGQRAKVPLDEDHKKLIAYLKDNNLLWWWDQDNHMLVTHTMHLKSAHGALGFKGIFETCSEGKDLNTQNCFCYAMRRGAWTVRRFGQGVQEHESWSQDTGGWTRTYLNREPDLPTAAKAYGGLEDPKGGFIFTEGEMAMKAVSQLGVQLNLERHYAGRQTKINLHKDGRLVAIVERKDMDRAEDMKGWLAKKDTWTKMFNTQTISAPEVEIANYDDIVRHLIAGQEDAGWVIKSDGEWRAEPLIHIKAVLASDGNGAQETTTIIGNAIMRAWKIVNKPFQSEYPGDREWNRNAAQLRFLPTKDIDNLKYPTWAKILQHCGKGLDAAIAKNNWCKSNGIENGADYLKCWICSIFKEPMQPLPYLFFYSKEQGTGKSMFWEALSLLLTKGCQKAEVALTSQQSFNGELEGAIICSVEEIDLNSNKLAYNRIKDWVTARELLIHPKGGQAYNAPNTTHWIQCSNNPNACPIFDGDTRITMVHVPKIPVMELIAKKSIIPLLEKEAPDFLAEILNIELPVSPDRLNLPVIETEEKLNTMEMNKSQLDLFIAEYCVLDHGSCIKFSDFHAQFMSFCDPQEAEKWGKINTGKEIPPEFVKARHRKDAQLYIGNIKFKSQASQNPGKKFVVNEQFLDLVDL